MTTHRVQIQNKTFKRPKVSLTAEYFQQLNADLGAEFTLFAFEHPDWLERHLPNGATLVFQMGEPSFDRWSRDLVERGCKRGTVTGPVVLVQIRKMRPRKSRIVQAEIKPFAARTAG